MDCRKRISCRRCQLRKLKCSRIDPCDNCVNSSNACSFRENDTRRRPVNRAYVAALEERLASYESTIRSLQQQTVSGPSFCGPTSAFTQLQSTPQMVLDGVSSLVFDYSGSSRVSTLTLQPSPHGHRSFYGPTSIYQEGCIANEVSRQESTPSSSDAFQNILMSGCFKIEDAMLKESLSMFFQYLATECPIVDGAVLMGDLTQNKHMGKFWSHSLLYAICCLGARISQHQQVSTGAGALAQCAHKLLSVKSLQCPHLTTVQAYLCLSVFEFRAGNNTKGWMLSGMAFHMVRDMGLHQDPRFLVEYDSSISSNQEIRIRRKLYWGCYVMDKIISLYFGRPMSLREEDASVDPLDPEADSINEAVLDGLPFAFSTNMKPSQPTLVPLVQLSQIAESIMTELFSTRLIKLPRDNLVSHRAMKLEELNVRLFQWHTSLPEALTWNQWIPTTECLPPWLVILHALYHSCIISLNRYFIRPTPGFARKSHSREVSMVSAESIITLTRQYRSQYSLAKAPLVLVYSLAMASTAVTFALGDTAESQDQSPEYIQQMKFISKALSECAKVSGFATHVCNKLQRDKIRTQRADLEEHSSLLEDIQGVGQEFLGPLDPLYEVQTEMEGSIHVPSDCDGSNFPEPDDIGKQLEELLFVGDQEGEAMSPFDWNDIMV